MKTRFSYHGKQLQLVLMLAGSSLLASRPAAAYNENEYSAELERLSTLLKKEEIRFQAANIDLAARETGILEKKTAIEQQEAALTTSILGMDKLIARTELLFAGNDPEEPSKLASFFQRPAELLRKRSPLPPLLEKVEQLYCASTLSEAQGYLDQLFDISAPGTEWPDEWLGKPKTTPQLHAASMDIILATLKRTVEHFPALRKHTERVALQWDYCPLLEQGVLHDLKLSERQLERVKVAPNAPLQWKGFRDWGFIGSQTERKSRFIPSLLDEITIAPYAYQIFLHQAYRKHCFPHPVTGEQYTETDAEKGPLRSFFPPPPDEPMGQYPYQWHPRCEIPQVGFQAKPAWPKAVLQKANAHLASLQQEVEAAKADLNQLAEAKKALQAKRVQMLQELEQKISKLKAELARERKLAAEAAEAAVLAEATKVAEAVAAESAAIAADSAARIAEEAAKIAAAEAAKTAAAEAAKKAAAAEKKRLREAEKAAKAAAAAEAEKQQLQKEAEQAAEAEKQKRLAAKAARAEAKKQKRLAEKAAAAKAEKARKRAEKAAAAAEKARKLALAAAEVEKQKKLVKIAALKKKQAAEAAQLRKLEQARKAAALKKKLALEAERKRVVEVKRQFKAATQQAVLEKDNYTIMREPPKGMVVIPTPGGDSFPFVYVDDQKTPFKDKAAKAKAEAAASKLKISGTFSFNIPVNGSSPSLNSSVTITPAENIFLTGSGSFKNGEFTYSWSGGYSDWRPGTISAQLNNWGPLKLGEGLALKKAVLNLGYKVDSDLLKKHKLSASLGMSAPLSGKTPTVSATMQWSPKENWYFRTTVSESLKGGMPNWNYGFGYYDWKPGALRVEYSNYGSNKFPLDNLKDGTITISRGWSF